MDESPTPPSVVVGIDGSKAAVHAALWAIDEAVSRDIPLRLLYAIEPDDTESVRPGRAARKLAVAENAVRYAFMAVEAADKPVKIEVEITQERAIASLIRASTSAAMVCVGAVGAHHFQPGRVGSTAAALAVSAHCPVAVIRGHGDRAARHAHWIVVDAHGSADDGALLGIAIEEARLCSAPLRAITCRQTGVRDIGDAGATDDDDRRILANSGPSACPLDATLSGCPGGVRGRAWQRSGLRGCAWPIGAVARRQRPRSRAPGTGRRTDRERCATRCGLLAAGR